MSVPSRRTLLAGLAALSAAAPALADVSPPDPTHALIKAHQAAYDRFSAALEEGGKLGPVHPEIEAKQDAASEAEDNALEALLTPEPTTLAGLRALAEYMRDYDAKMNGPWYSNDPTRWALATIAETCRALIPEGSA